MAKIANRLISYKLLLARGSNGTAPEKAREESPLLPGKRKKKLIRLLVRKLTPRSSKIATSEIELFSEGVQREDGSLNKGRDR